MPVAEPHVIKDMNHLLRDFSGVHTLLNCQWQYKQSVEKPLSGVVLTYGVKKIYLTMGQISQKIIPS